MQPTSSEEASALPAGFLQMDRDYGRLCRVGWTGDWPPPEKFLLVEPVIDPFPKWIDADPDERAKAAIAKGIAHGWKVRIVERVNYSKIPDEDIVTMTHVARGAEYRVVGEYTP